MSNTIEKSSTKCKSKKITIRLSNMKVNGDLYKGSYRGEVEAKLE